MRMRTLLAAALLATSARAAHQPLRLKRFACFDRQGIGLEAFSFFGPADWQFRGGVVWTLRSPAMPATIAFTVTSSDGACQLEAFPTQLYFWTNNPMVLQTFPPGSVYLGSEVRPPVGPVEVLQQMVIPAHRRGAAGMRVVEAKVLPELARQLGAGQQSAPGVQSRALGGKVKVRYSLGQTAFEEDFYCVVESTAMGMQSLYGMVVNINWLPSYIFSFRAPEGKLEALRPTFELMVRTFKINPRWFNKYNQLINILVQNKIRQINNIGRISRIISQTNDEISDMVMSSWRQRNAVYDRLADQFSQTIRGVDEYVDPNSNQKVELPSGYDRAWTNGLGEYILSDNPNFDPNVGSNQNWTPLRR